MADVPGNLGDEIKSGLSQGRASHKDADVKTGLISEVESPEQQNREIIFGNKETKIKPDSGTGKSEGMSYTSKCKLAEKPNDAATSCYKETETKPHAAVGKSEGTDKTLKCKHEEKPDDPATFDNKETEIKPDDGVGKYEDKDGILKCEHAEKPDDPADAKEAEISVFNGENPEGTDGRKEAKTAAEKSGTKPAVVFKCNLEACAGECTLSNNDPEIPDNKIKCVDTETVHDKEGALKRSPKTRGSRAKHSPYRISVLSSASSGYGKDTGGCFCRISPKRIYNLFKIRSPKCKESPNRSTAFSPMGDGKHFEVVYLGQYSPNEHERVERIDYTNMAEEKIIPTFLGSRPCYDVMPTSGKVVVFSVELLVKNAFSALVSNEIKAAPLWDAGIMDFVGMLTISDFINVLKYYYISKPEDMKDIENQTIATWRRMTGVPKKFVKINGQDSLVQAAKLLIQESIHRIPVFDEKRQCVLFVLTKKRLLQFLSQGLLEKFDKTNVRTPSFFKKTIRELKIGTFEDIAVVYKDTKIIDALSIFVTRNVSALPVLNKDNILIDLFEKFDVFGLAKDQTYHNLEMTVDDVISRPYARETAWICTMDETLQTVINKFVARKVHRLVVIDARRGVAGMISLSDILKFLVVQPLGLMESATVSDTILEGTEGAVGGTEAESPSEVDLAAGIAHMKVGESSEPTDDTQEEEEP